eukprot:5383833-Pyramimonas_sp.AAC.1
MDAEIRAIMAQYMPLDKEADGDEMMGVHGEAGPDPGMMMGGAVGRGPEPTGTYTSPDLDEVITEPLMLETRCACDDGFGARYEHAQCVCVQCALCLHTACIHPTICCAINWHGGTAAGAGVRVHRDFCELQQQTAHRPTWPARG